MTRSPDSSLPLTPPPSILPHRIRWFLGGPHVSSGRNRETRDSSADYFGQHGCCGGGRQDFLLPHRLGKVSVSDGGRKIADFTRHFHAHRRGDRDGGWIRDIAWL